MLIVQTELIVHNDMPTGIYDHSNHPTTFKKGNSGYWLGKKRKGTYKIASPKFGKESPHWKGGISTLNKLERERFRREMQTQVFERDNYTCQLCGQKGGHLQVDHIQSWKDFVELRFSMENCRTLCDNCHYLITYGKAMPKNVKAWGHNLKHSAERMVL